MTAISAHLLLLNPQDNCLVACQNLQQGATVVIEGMQIHLMQDVPLGYKVARCDLRVDQVVLRYGAHIGSTTQTVRAGELLHTHNLKSNYLPTYKAGDLTNH